MIVEDHFQKAFHALPTGTFYGYFKGRKYVISRTSLASYKAHKLVANACVGSDYISLNLYDLSSGHHLKPCEMSLGKVIDFVLKLRPIST